MVNDGENKDLVAADSLMTIVRQTPHYTITLKIKDLRFNISPSSSPLVYNIAGVYLVKVR